MTKDKFSTTELLDEINEFAIENSYLKGKIEVLEKMLYNSNLLNLETKSKTSIDKNNLTYLLNLETKSKTSIDKNNLTYQELLEVAPKDGKCFYIEVESNPIGQGGRKKLLAYLTTDGKKIGTNLTENTPDGFWSSGDWENDYKGKFKLIED